MNNPIEKLTLVELLELELNISKNFALNQVANQNGDLEIIYDYTKHQIIYHEFLIYIVENKITINKNGVALHLNYGQIAKLLIHNEVIKKKSELQESHDKDK